MLMRLNSKYFIKADDTAIVLLDSCFAVAVEFLFMAFYTYLQWTIQLYYFLERILKIDSSEKSSVLTDILRKLTHMAQSQNPVTGDMPMGTDHE